MIDALILGGLFLVVIVIGIVTAGQIIDRVNQNKDFSKNLDWINNVKAEGRMDDPNEMYGIIGGVEHKSWDGSPYPYMLSKWDKWNGIK